MSSKGNNTGKSQGMPLLTGFAGIVIVFLILIFANVLIAKMNIRWDATGEKLYSLSSATKGIASKLKNPVTIKFFYSEDNINIPANIKAYAKRVRDFLGEYENAGSGKIILETINPVYDSEEEDLAQKYGVKGLSLPTGEKVYFGLVALSADQEEVIQYLDPTREAQLEYDITRAITRVQNPSKEKIGIITGLPVMGMSIGNPMQAGMSKPWVFVNELKKTYDISQIGNEEEKIPADIKLLMLINPDSISDKMLKAIDGYVASGGNIIALSDPVNISGEVNPMAGPKGMDRNFEKLLASWGVEIDSQKIIADFFYPTQLYSQRNPGSVESNPTWISAQKALFDQNDTITGRLENMLFPIAGAIKLKEVKGLKATPLIKSSKSSALVESFKAQLGGELGADFKPTGEVYNIAVKISGKFPSLFNETPAGGDAAKADSEAKTSTVIVVSDADFIYDAYYVEKQNFLGFEMAQVFNDNLNFFLNSTELLTGNPELAQIRAGGTFSRPFTKVRDMELKAREKWYAQEVILEKRAEETNQKLQALNSKKSENQTFVLNPEQEAEIKRFQEEKRKINKELKSVRRNLKSDIESLGNVIKLVNIFLMPLLIIIAGVVFAIRRRQNA
ncbi:GldG family protein [Desulforegula conservatrix]|uniref:GldG family protein n=1 Tax=Desulforegula conservatrix TaxID=153026 RepID=UPI000402031F|nr:Gldg family protein [Desulforegula conservatrix]